MRFTEVHLTDVSSTNDYAKELLRSQRNVFVTAQHQSLGRGRNGRTWIGDFGLNAYCSVGVNHGKGLENEDASSYMGRGALSVLHSLRAIAPSQKFKLKYPNDVQAWTDEGWAKIAGTLVEHEYRGDVCKSTVVGMGVNVGQRLFPDTIDQVCTSLFLLGEESPVSTFIEQLRKEVGRYFRMSWQEVHKELGRRAWTRRTSGEVEG